MDQVVLVDSDDNEIGICEKLEAHQNGLLHRAFSIFLFNDKKEWLMQQRADGKYHSPGLWSNTCCSHPKPNETIEVAAQRRLMEEVNMDVDLTKRFSFQYKCDFENGLIEHELDHILTGHSNEYAELNLEEVQAMKFVTFDSLQQDIQDHPENYTVWLKLIYERVWEVVNS